MLGMMVDGYEQLLCVQTIEAIIKRLKIQYSVKKNYYCVRTLEIVKKAVADKNIFFILNNFISAFNSPAGILPSCRKILATAS